MAIFKNKCEFRQIEADVKSGRLEQLIQCVQADINANRVKPLEVEG